MSKKKKLSILERGAQRLAKITPKQWRKIFEKRRKTPGGGGLEPMETLEEMGTTLHYDKPDDIAAKANNDKPSP